MDSSVLDLSTIKHKIGTYLSSKRNPWILDSNNSFDPYGSYEFIGACGIKEELFIENWTVESPKLIDEWISGVKEFRLITLSYDLKHALQSIPGDHEDVIEWPLFYSFVPETLIRINRNNELFISSSVEEPDLIYQAILDAEELKGEKPSIEWTENPNFDSYKQSLKTIFDYLRDGEIYEANFCHLFGATILEDISEMEYFNYWNQKIKKPFSALIQWKDSVVLCFSPERFLAKSGSKIITQPIKGTLDMIEGKITEKEYAENVMIVDLCRNDLSRICKTGTVEVDELMGMYGFTNIRHLISTVSGELKENVSFMSILESCFPMGSMTGAPKYSAMKVIEELEDFNRGIFSGSIGYINESGDFDLNVVIRSMLLDRQSNRAHVPVGGAIVFDSRIKEEYDETLKKIMFFKA